MNKIILGMKIEIAQRYVCIILCLLLPIALMLAPGNYEVSVRSSTDVIMGNIIRNQQYNEMKKSNAFFGY